MPKIQSSYFPFSLSSLPFAFNYKGDVSRAILLLSSLRVSGDEVQHATPIRTWATSLMLLLPLLLSPLGLRGNTLQVRHPVNITYVSCGLSSHCCLSVPPVLPVIEYSVRIWNLSPQAQVYMDDTTSVSLVCCPYEIIKQVNFTV